MANRWKVDPRTIPTLQKMPRRDRPVTGENTLREIEFWVVAIVVVVAMKFSFGMSSLSW